MKQILDAILADELDSVAQLDVPETYRGVVQLSGFVDNEAMAQRAVERARQVAGVRSVKNDMQVRSAARS